MMAKKITKNTETFQNDHFLYPPLPRMKGFESPSFAGRRLCDRVQVGSFLGTRLHLISTFRELNGLEEGERGTARLPPWISATVLTGATGQTDPCHRQHLTWGFPLPDWRNCMVGQQAALHEGDIPPPAWGGLQGQGFLNSCFLEFGVKSWHYYRHGSISICDGFFEIEAPQHRGETLLWMTAAERTVEASLWRGLLGQPHGMGCCWQG